MKIKKFLDKICDFLPGQRVYFIYTHNSTWDRFGYGLKANTEISHWCLRSLKKAFPRVTFLRLQGEKEWRINKITSRDVVIGHTGETYRKACQRTKRIIAFCPWSGHENRNQVDRFNCALTQQEREDFDKASSLILLTSEFNKAKYLQHKANDWYDFFSKKRVLPVHQPMDFTLFPRIKFDYTTSNFLYIGNDGHMKCLDDSRNLTGAVQRKLTIYGPMTRTINNLDSAAINRLPGQADFFIQPGMWEAQCVSILESAARGFIPLVSPETGYPYDHPFLLRYGDLEYNLKILRKLLKTSPQERKQLADTLHQQLMDDINHNNWDTLTDVLVEEVKTLL